MAILIENKGLNGRFKISGNSTGGFKARYVAPPIDAQAFFDRVTAAGGTLSVTEQNAIIQLVANLKSAGIWTLMKAIYPMVGASAAACAQNLKSSSFTGIFSGAITYASTGITGNGTNGYMNTNLNSSIHLGLNDAHISVYLRNNLADNNCDIGNYNGSSSATTIYSRTTSDTQYARINDVDNTSPSTSDSRGFRMASRLGPTSKINVINSSITTISANSVSVINNNIFLMALNNSANATQFSVRENAFTSIGDGLTNLQSLNLYSAVQAFQTSLSRQV